MVLLLYLHMPSINKNSRKKWQGERKAFGRKSIEADNSDFYNSQSWRRDRSAYLRQYPLCRMCEAKGYYKAATVCDHITPINEGGDKWDWSNRQALCETCHNKKSGGEVRTRWKNR